MSNSLRHRIAHIDPGRLSIGAFAGAAVLVSFLSGDCRRVNHEPESKETRQVEALESKVRASLDALHALSWQPRENKWKMLSELERIGDMMMSNPPGRLLSLHRGIEKDIEGLDKRLRTERKRGANGASHGLVELLAACTSDDSAGGRMGSLFLAVQFLPRMMDDKMPGNPSFDDVNQTIYDRVIAGLYVDSIGQMSQPVREWAEGKDPFSDATMLRLFEAIRQKS